MDIQGSTPQNEERKDSNEDSSPEIIFENSNRDTERGVNSTDQLLILPPIFLADPNFSFPDSPSIFSPEQQNKLDLTLILSRKICWLSIIDCIFITFILYYGIYYLVVAVIFLPIIGFIGSKKFNSKLCILYLCYLVSVVALRIILLILKYTIPVLIIQVLICLLELYITVLDTKFINLIKNLTSIERDYLLGRRYFQRNQENIPDDVAVKILEAPPNVYHSS